MPILHAHTTQQLFLTPHLCLSPIPDGTVRLMRPNEINEANERHMSIETSIETPATRPKLVGSSWLDPYCRGCLGRVMFFQPARPSIFPCPQPGESVSLLAFACLFVLLVGLLLSR